MNAFFLKSVKLIQTLYPVSEKTLFFKLLISIFQVYITSVITSELITKGNLATINIPQSKD